jgi:hypothetical protein
MRQVAMLAERLQLQATFKVILLWAWLGLSGALLAADTDLPEMDFLEYLGLWEESDEDWVWISEEMNTQVVAEDTRTEETPKGEDSAEKEDES